ncbi:MAG: response regulator transcription factor [Oscillibacter sp.]|nr:response regulator transcription factor [Oscillibacter sp.]
MMETLLIAVCEDDPDEYQELLSILQCVDIPTSCERFADGAEFLNGFCPGKYDLVLMDIYMDGLSGVDAVSRLREQDSATPVAFITSSLDHAMDGYRLHVARYLHKPLQTGEVEEVLRFALREKANEAGVSLPTGTVSFRQIRYVEQSNHDLIFHLTGGREARARERLDRIEGQFPVPPFFRPHKSYLVNLYYVRYLDRELNAFEMNGGGTAYIRRSSVREAAKALQSTLFRATRES